VGTIWKRKIEKLHSNMTRSSIRNLTEMKRKKTPRFFVSTLLSIALLAGCSTKYSKTVVLVSDKNGINDHSYNEYTFKALLSTSSQIGFTIDKIIPTENTQYASSIEEAILKQPVMIVVSSGELETAATLKAADNQDIYFVFIDAKGDLDLDNNQDSSNIFAALFAHEEIGYIAGAASALSSRAKNIAFIGEHEYVTYVEYESGFLAGAKAINPKVLTKVEYISPQTAEEKISKKFEKLKASGIDVIFTVAENPLIYKYADKNGMYIINNNNSYQSSKVDMTINKEYGEAATLVAKEYQSGTFKGQVKYYTVKDGCITYQIKNSALISKASKRELENVFNELKSGKLNIPKTR
jgi:basic membrane protein A